MSNPIKESIEKAEKSGKVFKLLKKDTLQISSKSKKIKKKKLEEEIKPIKKIKPRIGNYGEFVKQETSKLKKIKKRTYEKIKIDRELVQKAVSSLLKHHHKEKEAEKHDILEGEKDFVYLEVNLSQVPEEYSIRPIQMYFLFALI